MNNEVFANKAKDIAQNYKTLYVMGAFGACLYTRNKKRYSTNNDYNRQTDRTEKIMAASNDTFAFDCCGLIKGVLWGWSGKTNPLYNYGGAAYESNDVPDIGANAMIDACSDVSTDFSEIEVGEAVWTTGHIGIYIGNGLAVEATPSWQDKVQITAVRNIGRPKGYNSRTWKKHGKLPWIEYPEAKPEQDDDTQKGMVEVQTRLIYKGSKGEDVKSAQALLNLRGYNCGNADGIFGQNTDAATRAFQKAKGYTVDGKIGEETWDGLVNG